MSAPGAALDPRVTAQYVVSVAADGTGAVVHYRVEPSGVRVWLGRTPLSAAQVVALLAIWGPPPGVPR